MSDPSGKMKAEVVVTVWCAWTDGKKHCCAIDTSNTFDCPTYGWIDGSIMQESAEALREAGWTKNSDGLWMCPQHN